MTRENKRVFAVFASIMERAVVAVDRADVYINGNEQVRQCIRVLDEATEAVRKTLEKPAKKAKND